MFFEPMYFVAAGVTIGVAVLDKTLESFGLYFLQDLLKVLLPLSGLVTGIYFLEHNPIMGWFK